MELSSVISVPCPKHGNVCSRWEPLTQFREEKENRHMGVLYEPGHKGICRFGSRAINL